MTRSQENVSVALQEGSDVLEFPGALENNEIVSSTANTDNSPSVNTWAPSGAQLINPQEAEG